MTNLIVRNDMKQVKTLKKIRMKNKTLFKQIYKDKIKYLAVKYVWLIMKKAKHN